MYVILPNKDDARIRRSNCTISLIFQASKILLKVIRNRLEPYMERERADAQA